MYLVILLLVLLIVVTLAVGARRGVRFGFLSGRRPRPRHVAVRIICGALGVAILVAVAIGTVHEVNQCYAPVPPAKAMTVGIPTKPLPAPEMPGSVANWPVTAKTRFLVDILAMDSSSGEPLAVAERHFEIEWPAQAGKRFEHEFVIDDVRMKVSMNVMQATATRASADAPKVIEVLGNWHVEYSGRGGHADEGLLCRGPVWRLSFGSPRLVYPTCLLSVAAPAKADPVAYCFVTPAAPDDPLRGIPVGEFLTSHREELNRLGFEQDLSSLHASWLLRNDNMPARGFALIAHIGISSLLLLIAAILISQVFTNRALVFPAMLAAVILYVAALDRTALGMHLARLDDAKATPAVRTVACVQATETFFYGRTALERIDAVAKDEASPKELKDLASDAAKRMRERMKS